MPPTPLEIANAPGARRGVVVYRPAMQRQVAPTRRTNAPIRGATRASGPVDWDALMAKATSTKASQRKQQEAFEKQAKDEAWDDTPWYGKGLGMVLGNPLVRNALVPLGVLGTGSKAATLGIEETMEHLAPYLPASFSSGTLGALNQVVDTERTEADTRSNWSKLAPTSDYGFGQLLDPDNPAWANRIGGFVGDVTLDPLNLVGGGATRVAGGVQRGAKIAEGAEAATRAASHLDEVAELAQVGKFDDVGRVSQLAAEQDAIARRVAADLAKPVIEAPVHQGRKAREALLGEIAQFNPALYERYSDELTRGAERGFNTIKNQELRDALGLIDPSIRFAGQAIPGTRRIAERGAAIGGAVRAKANQAPLLGKAMEAFTPQGLEESSKILSRGGQGDALRAATTVRIQNLMRRGAGEMEGRGNKALTDMVRQLRKLGGEDEIRALLREAETDEAPNLLNKLFGHDLPALYHEVAGRPMDVSRNRDTYIPHMHTPEGRRFLATLDKDTVEDLGFQADDLLEGSKYLEKSRKLTPDTVGVPKDFEIGSRGTITLTDGTIDEINEELGRLFPEFKGKFYQDDPVTIGEAYVSSIARQAGRDRALDALADSPNPLVREITGELAESVEARNAFMRQNPVTQKIREGFTAGQRLIPVRGKGEMPVTPFDDMLALTKHFDESQAQRDLAMKEGKQFVADVNKDTSAARTTMTDTLKGLRTTLMDGLKGKGKELDAKILAVKARLGAMDLEIQKLGPLTSENLEETVATQATVRAAMTQVKSDIKKIQDRYGKQIPRDLDRVEKELQATLRRLQSQEDKLAAQHAKGTLRLREEAKLRREALEAPVKAAKEKMDQAEARLPKRAVSDERVQKANAELRSDFVSEDAFEADRQLYFDELNRLRAEGKPIYRTVDGRLTPETTATVQAAVIEKKSKAAAVAAEAAAPPPTPEQKLTDFFKSKQATPEPEVTAPAPPTPKAPDPEQLAKNAQQLLKTSRKAVKDAEKRLKEATTALSEGQAAGVDPERIRLLEYGVQTTQARLDDARNTLGFAERTAQQAAAPAAVTPASVETATPASVEDFGPGTPGYPSAQTHSAQELREMQQGLRNVHKDLVAYEASDAELNEIEQQLDAIAAEIRAAEAGGASTPGAPPAPAEVAPPPAPAAPPNKLVKSGTNVWQSGDGFILTKNSNSSWHVTTTGGQDFGIFKSKGEATDHIEFMQEMIDMPVGGGAPVEAAATPAAVTEAVPEPPAATPAAVTEAEPAPTKPLTQRLRHKWTKQDFHGRQIEVGPSSAYYDPVEGVRSEPAAWEIHTYEPVLPRSQWPEDVDRVRGQPTGGKIRYVATHPKDPGMRGRTFASARAAKQAVQDHLLRQERRTTVEEYVARSAGRSKADIPVAATYENLSGVREFPPSTLTPKQAEANKARAAATPTRPARTFETTMGPNELALTPEGAALEEMRPPAQPTNVHPEAAWQRAYGDWQQALQQAKDPSLSGRERRIAADKARSLGAEFTQRNGKYYSKNASQKIMIEDIAWQMKREADPAYAKAQADYLAEVAKADAQVEAMVYTKHHNPVTGTDEYTRLPSGSMTGFLEEEGAAERVAVPIEVPKQGEVPTPPAGQLRDPWNTGYSSGQRAEDRAVIEAGSTFVLGPKSYEYDEMRIQAQGITERLDNAARNETELRQLDDAAKRAYSGEVQAADQAVKDAKLAEQRARMDMNPSNFSEGQRPPADAGAIYDAARRRTQEAVDRQTEARQAWMEADRAWKAKLAERDEYRKVADQVSSAERAIAQATNQAYDGLDSKGRPVKGIIDEVRRGNTPRPGGYDMDTDMRKLVQRLQRADIELDEFDRAGYTYLTDIERRDEAGKLVAIDTSMRKLLNERSEGIVKHTDAILPSKTADQITRAPSPLSGRGVPAQIEGSGQSDLTRRAYAESFGPSEPSPTPRTTTEEITRERIIPEGKEDFLAGEEKVLEERLQENPVQPYKPVTERQRITEMESAVEQADALNVPMRQERERIAGERTEAEGVAAQGRAAVDALAVERDEKLLPLRDRAQTLKHVDEALNDKAKLLPQREQAKADLQTVVDTAVRGKITTKADLVQIANDIEKVAKQNPDLLKDDLAVVEALLHDLREEAKRVTDNDLTSKQVQAVIDKVSQKGDTTLDVMLTTVGKNWKMLYDANGPKRAVLQPGDTILQADLHRMFQNLYEIKKDPVLFGRTLNAFTNLFKTYATLSPGFHVRNALSAIFMNATDGVAMKTQLSAARIWRDYMKAEDSEAWLADLTTLHGFSGDEIRNAFAATHGSGAGGRFTEAGFASGAKTGHWTDVLSKAQRNKVTRFSQRVGERVEGSVRLAMGLDAMTKGDDVEQAIQRINRIHFDYGEISKLDANMKRVVPFWTFMSRNMPMQVSQMWTHPQVYLGYERFVKNFSAENEEYTPEYWTKAGAWNTGLQVPGIVPERFGGGLPISVQPDLGFTRLASDLKDYEDFLSGKRLGGVLSSTNPLLSAPVEFATRQDIFTGQKFEEGETVPVGGPLGFPVKLLAGLLGQTSGGEVDAAFMNSIRAVNPLQDRSTRLLPQATGGDPEAIKRQLESWLRFGGAPVRTLTPKQQENEMFRRYYDQMDAQKQQQDRQRRQAG